MSKIFIIDRMTLLAEEAAALASTVEMEDDVLHITEPIVKVLEPSAVQTTELLDETLNNNGVQTQRIMTKTVRVTTPKTGVVTVQKDTARHRSGQRKGTNLVRVCDHGRGGGNGVFPGK